MHSVGPLLLRTLGSVNCLKMDRAECAGASGSRQLLLWLKTITSVYLEPLLQPTLFGEVCGIEQGIKSPGPRGSAALRQENHSLKMFSGTVKWKSSVLLVVVH